MNRPATRYAFVTGASAGTGRAIAQTLAAEGYGVGLVARREAALTQLAGYIEAEGGLALPLVCDLRDEAATNAAIDQFLAWSGTRCDALINAAGIPGPLSPPIGEYSLAAFDEVIATNLRAPFITMSRLLPVMKEARSGRIINIGGNHGLRGRAGRSSYAASKWALRGLTKSAALEAGPFDVTVNLIAPGAIAVDRMKARWDAAAEAEGTDAGKVLENYVCSMNIALGRTNEPADIVAMVLFLLSEGARNITGQDLVIDGGVIV